MDQSPAAASVAGSRNVPPVYHDVPPHADRVVVSINPRAGSGPDEDRVHRLIGLVAQRGLHVQAFADLDEASALANQWHGQGMLRALVAAGGDGTASELLNRTQEGVHLALLPLGTENLLARHLHIGGSPEALCEIICRGRAVELDAGRATTPRVVPGRLFLAMASCGFDADVVHRFHQQRRGHIRA